MILNHLKIDFENVEIEKADWGTMKASNKAGELGFLPMVSMKGKDYQCTGPILRQIGANHGLYNLKNAGEMYRADSACDVFFDVFGAVAKINFAPNPDAQKAALESLMGTVLPNTFKFLENRFTKLNCAYVSGSDKLCYADFTWASFMCTIAHNTNFPFSAGILQQMEMYPKTKEYLKRME